jgi:hypothetical protein
MRNKVVVVQFQPEMFAEIDELSRKHGIPHAAIVRAAALYKAHKLLGDIVDSVAIQEQTSQNAQVEVSQ